MHNVIAGLDPAIHEAFPKAWPNVRLSMTHFIMDARVKPAHDARVCSHRMKNEQPYGI
jgi:hypothetical protein